MNFVKIALTTLVILLAACSSKQSQMPLETTLQFDEFSEKTMKYYPQPTVVGISESEKEATILLVGEGSTYAKDNLVSFGESNAAKYISMLDTYLEWEVEARDYKRTNIHKKPIGKVPDASQKAYLYFMFYSGNTDEYRMIISDCDWLCTEDSVFQHYDKANVIELKRLLRMLKKQELKDIVKQTTETN
ncbi:hypothetical protein L3Q72_22280 [Vibrio sp. JC009]|uniref:hypothetical protein n=1 Tax=Vibrio sp. JC009 TaxID=2912314 RepID=UPI0023B0D16C|nr:hypothetical protein [Vibrio sp. JC009]WED23962.1 hypothetical protein L3Q72_22280 [Vibrio sp. JC009]